MVSSPGSNLVDAAYRHTMENSANIQFAEDQPVSLNWNTFWLPHWQLPLPTYFSERPRKKPYSEAAECLGQPGEEAQSGCVCAHLSSFGPKELPHDGEVEASIVLSQKLGLVGGNQSPLVQTSCRGYDSKVTVLAICNLKSCVHVYKYICDVLPQPDGKHLCFMVCNSSSVSRQRQRVE